jgi:hypothetical protein
MPRNDGAFFLTKTHAGPVEEFLRLVIKKILGPTKAQIPLLMRLRILGFLS